MGRCSFGVPVMRSSHAGAPNAIVEATRLVAAGRPAEATALLQGSLGIEAFEVPTPINHGVR